MNNGSSDEEPEIPQERNNKSDISTKLIIFEREIKPKFFYQIGAGSLRKSHSDIGKPTFHMSKVNDRDMTTTTTFRNSDTNSDIPIRTEKEKFDKYNNKTVQLHKNVLQVKNEFEYDKKIPLSPDTAKAKRNLEMDKEKKGKDLTKQEKKSKDKKSRDKTPNKSSSVITEDDNQSDIGQARRKSKNRTDTITENAPA